LVPLDPATSGALPCHEGGVVDDTVVGAVDAGALVATAGSWSDIPAVVSWATGYCWEAAEGAINCVEGLP
jgi:hypothetical protein